MINPELCTEEEIAALVGGFYGRVRTDPLLGPVFEAHIDDWPPHLAKMCDFWSSLLRGTARYGGTPMRQHAVLPELSAPLFERWLTLFHETTATLENEAMRARAEDFARRIASSLWMGWQVNNRPDHEIENIHFTQN